MCTTATIFFKFFIRVNVNEFDLIFQIKILNYINKFRFNLSHTHDNDISKNNMIRFYKQTLVQFLIITANLYNKAYPAKF